jgi:hypothetical protein
MRTGTHRGTASGREGLCRQTPGQPVSLPVITHDTLRIEMNMRGGSLILVAGPGIIVDADSLAVR